MAEKLTFQYDRDADILYINKLDPYPEQESEELGDEVVARLNPSTGEVESVEVLFFSTRLLRQDLFELPISAEMHLAGEDEPPRPGGNMNRLVLSIAFLGLWRRPSASRGGNRLEASRGDDRRGNASRNTE